MPKRINTVTYHNPDIGGDTHVHRIQPESVTARTAGLVLNLLVDSYSATYEDKSFTGPSGPLPKGSVKRQFRPNKAADARQADKMIAAMRAGSTYWYVNPFDDGPQEQLFSKDGHGFPSGLIKVSPSKSRLQRLGLLSPNCYIDDLIVAPAYQYNSERRDNHHLESILLHTIYESTDYRNKAKVAFDVYEGQTDILDRTEAMGFEAVADAGIAEVAIAGRVLPQIRYASQPGFYLQKHAQMLEQPMPWLMGARVA